MKNLFLFLILISFNVVAQKSIQAPKTVFDTTNFNFKWAGGLEVVVKDSSFSDSTGFHWRKNFISLNNSYVKIKTIKRRVLAPGDTIVREEILKVRFIDCYSIIEPFYTNVGFKKQYKKGIRKTLNKKISQE